MISITIHPSRPQISGTKKAGKVQVATPPPFWSVLNWERPYLGKTAFVPPPGLASPALTTSLTIQPAVFVRLLPAPLEPYSDEAVGNERELCM